MPILIDPGPSEAGWHRLQTALQCPRKYALGREKSYTLSDPLVKGVLVHLGLAQYYARMKAKLNGQDPDEFYEPIAGIGKLALDNYTEDKNELWMEHAALAQHVVASYINHWKFDKWEPLYIEEQFRSHVTDDEGNRFLYTQRADLIVKDSGGKIWIVDHKTTFRISPKTVRRYTLSGQFLGYRVLGKRAFGANFGGVVLNMIQLPRTLKESPSYKRPTLEPAPYALRTFKQTLIAAEGIIKQHQHLDDPMLWPAVHHETACWTPYGPCPYHETCQYGF
tara:strand:- start:1112 stop:1948 length:837 start_codon:yes stop_codon:yes gene_type:complete